MSSVVGSGASRASGHSRRSCSQAWAGTHANVDADLAARRLLRIKLEGPQTMIKTMHAAYRLDALPGPAARWLANEVRTAE